MKLPNYEHVIVPDEKITGYLLNLEHTKGRGKAQFFLHFGFSMAQWKQLAEALIAHAQLYEVVKIEQTPFGERYVLEGALSTPTDRKPLVRVVWFIGHDDSIPRLVTAYPLGGEND